MDRVYVILSGEILLDTGNESQWLAENEFVPFLHTQLENCYCFTSNSILGDEGLIGWSKKYAATAAVISEVAVVFEFTGVGLPFLARNLGVERYAALAYRDRSGYNVPLEPLQDEVTIHGLFFSLRQAISLQHPTRGVIQSAVRDVDRNASTLRHGQRQGSALSPSNTQLRRNPRRGSYVDEAVAQFAGDKNRSDALGGPRKRPTPSGAPQKGSAGNGSSNNNNLAKDVRAEKRDAIARSASSLSAIVEAGGGASGVPVSGPLSSNHQHGGHNDHAHRNRSAEGEHVNAALAKLTLAGEHHAMELYKTLRKRFHSQLKANAKVSRSRFGPPRL